MIEGNNTHFLYYFQLKFRHESVIIVILFSHYCFQIGLHEVFPKH
jgi:hypothetical protein